MIEVVGGLIYVGAIVTGFLLLPLVVILIVKDAREDRRYRRTKQQRGI